ncbi:MAG: chlorite dismutase family protein, partial [Candidatus Omnitrophota bacterium]
HPSAQRPPDVKIDLPDIREYGAAKDGTRQASDKRLFMQLLVYTECRDAQALVKPLEASGLEAVLYLDVNDPRGVGLLFMSEDPALFTGEVRKLLSSEPFGSLKPRPELTMIGRTYSIGHEQDLEDWLLRKPRRNAFNAEHRWAVWYPLRRRPEFELLSKDEQRAVLMEHARLGMGYGQADLAHDIRLACHGLDQNDNEFVLGIVSKDLYPISRLVHDMRKTQQTSRYIRSLGPFFVGKVSYSHSA